mmetsp:Transcript_1390/g.2105  ORF Transcript_1390/g.2105 Transcript_1390/m.2105 type:complete len:554 (-) Transcript_1390:233-1894(-)
MSGGALIVFDEAQAGDVDIDSSWRLNKSVSVFSNQTEPQTYEEEETQTLASKDVEVQATNLLSGIQSKSFNVNDESFLSFLRQVAPLMEVQLDLNSKSKAFDDYDVSWEQERGEVRCLFTLEHIVKKPTEAEQADALRARNERPMTGRANSRMPTTVQDDDYQDDGLPFAATGISWNSTGWVVAVSYGRYDHKGTCRHRSALRTWNLSRRTLNVNKADVTVETASCVMCVAYHPEQPSVVAAGGFNGEVMVFNLNRTEEPLVGYSKISDTSHREAVTQIEWLYDIRERSYHQLASISTDGRVLIWSMRNNCEYPVAGFHIAPDASTASSGRRGLTLGGSAMSFSKLDRSSFVVGTETGALFKCFFNSNLLGVLGKDKEAPKIVFTSPINFGFEEHAGPVHQVEFSPFHRSLFLSCSSDSSVRLYDVLQPKPITTLEPSSHYLYAVQWSRSRPLVFAVATGDGSVYIYDLEDSSLNPVIRLEANGGDKPVYSLAFNSKMGDFLATGDGAGVVKIWQLNNFLSSIHPREQDALDKLASRATDSDMASIGSAIKDL